MGRESKLSPIDDVDEPIVYTSKRGKKAESQIKNALKYSSLSVSQSRVGTRKGNYIVASVPSNLLNPSSAFAQSIHDIVKNELKSGPCTHITVHDKKPQIAKPGAYNLILMKKCKSAGLRGFDMYWLMKNPDKMTEKQVDFLEKFLYLKTGKRP